MKGEDCHRWIFPSTEGVFNGMMGRAVRSLGNCRFAFKTGFLTFHNETFCYAAELDIDLAAISQAGGWKSPRMPLQYAEKIHAARSGMARAAATAGRDEAASGEE
jgi:hypothetical protein